MPVVLKADAAEDLLEIWLFIAQDSIGAADKWIDVLDTSCSKVDH